MFIIECYGITSLVVQDYFILSLLLLYLHSKVIDRLHQTPRSRKELMLGHILKFPISVLKDRNLLNPFCSIKTFPQY